MSKFSVFFRNSVPPIAKTAAFSTGGSVDPSWRLLFLAPPTGQILYLGETHVTDKGLIHLKKLTALPPGSLTPLNPKHSVYSELTELATGSTASTGGSSLWARN
jgi:hypothetical protein